MFMGPYLVPMPRVPAISEIQAEVARHYHLKQSDMSSPARFREVARPRQVAMYLCRELTPRSLPEIGRKFGRDHTTVIHALRQISQLRTHDPDLDADIRQLKVALA